MKKILVPALALMALSACNNSATNTDHIETSSSKTVDTSKISGTPYKVDSTSTITWTGSKPTGNHSGQFKVSEGVVYVDNSNITGGNFTINMNSLVNLDLAGDPENKAKLEGHLKSPDFFNIEKFPVARFVISSVEPYKADSASGTAFKDATHMINGNLTLRDSTQNISFPAKITADASNVMATADFNIDRTRWGMNYKGPNNPQDWFIDKTVNLKLNISAKK